jgi:hypothetical protein
VNYVAPKLKLSSFHCPNCEVFAHQLWYDATYFRGQFDYPRVPDVTVSLCSHCGKYSIWLGDVLLFPEITGAPLPHPDTPPKVREDYEEARRVFGKSPRSSAALLRLAIQKTCIVLGQPGKNLNDDIGELVKAGLPVAIQRSLDIVRVVGNNQVHPGVLDVRDDPETATRLFELVNVIVEDRIARPKQIDALYMKLPEGARKQIEERDAKAAKTP